ncbi:type VI toxin-antitoxin system SocB family DNA replication inhibitor toxin [Desertibaculum subflavum]|uniref:type VI toxin-antitoxin system SocB family DNA replication inhibitor toxin n=1 Tax=Desertibaculum subflavum TaxID=2268458 RepID=UPI000E67311F
MPDIDLARIAPLPRELQRRQLEQIRFGRPPFSYGPLRGCLHDIFNVQPEMFGPVSPTDWAVIERHMLRKCKSDEELKANLAVARGLHGFAMDARMLGRGQDFFPLAMSTGRKVVFWLSMVLSLDGQPIVPFIDPRRTRGLNREARRFVFSMMNERVRAADPDFATVRFAIFQFGYSEEGHRQPRLYGDEGVSLFSFDELETMVKTTYEIWREVCEEREDEVRRKAVASGPLL